MAYSTGSSITLLVSNVPQNFSTSKLKVKLEDKTGRGSIERIEQDEENCVKVIVKDNKAQRKLLKDQITILFGGEYFELDIRQLEEDSSETEDENDDMFTYDAPDSNTHAILRYLSKKEEHKSSLTKALRKYHAVPIDISSGAITIQLLEGHGSTVNQSVLKKEVTDFIDRFSSWTEVLDSVSPANVKHIKSVLSQYRDKCFGSWFVDSSTILVTGPRKLVEEMENLVRKHLEHTTLKNDSTMNSKAHAFEYYKVSPAVMRFVSRQETIKQALINLLGDLGYITIANDSKTLSVKVSPKKKVTEWLHADFERDCGGKIKSFFDQFTTWKGKFDVAKIAMNRRHFPELFKPVQTYPDHFVQWHFDTGIVDVTGTCQQVNRCKGVVEGMMGLGVSVSPQSNKGLVEGMMGMGISVSPPSKYGEYVQQNIQHSPVRQPQFAPVLVVSTSPFPIVIPPVAHPQFVPATVPFKSQRSRRVSYGDGVDEESSSTSVETILFDPQETPAAVLKFVLNDAAAKKELEKICVKYAKVVVKNERGQVQIHVSSKKKNFSPAQKGNVNKAITDFLEKFDSKTRKFDKNKVENVIKDNRDIFKPKPGLFIQSFNNSTTVKITGRIGMMKKKLEEIDYEMECETEEEELPPDIFIAQRQCEVWKTVEEKCEKEGFKISISSSNEKSKIIYKGLPDSITRAKLNLGKICESLISHPVSGLSSDQLEFMKRCEESQKKLKTGKNILDSLYKSFQSDGVRGSLSFDSSSIVLITANEGEWKKGNLVLKKSVVRFEINPVLLQSKISYAKYFSDLKKYFDSSPVFVKDQRAVKKIMLVCFCFDLQEIKQQIKQFDDGIESIEDVKIFYPMSENVAQHISNHCKIEKAKNIQLVKEGRKTGLRITYDKEDSDTVEMRLDDLQQEITSKDIKLTGYSLFEYLTGEGKAALPGIERQTNCSIFLKSSGKVGAVKSFISVKVGNILDERCDAILNSTDAGLSLSGQMSRALIQKYGQNVIAHCIQTSKWLVPAQLCVCSSDAYNLPWKYIFNIVTPNDEQKLTHAIKNLLLYANSLGITSLALPTIGTGNMGLDPTSVAKCMKEAFAEVTQENFPNLKDVRLVLFDPTMRPIFEDVVSIKENMSSGAVATVYGNTPENLRQAEQGLKDFRDKIIKTSTIKNATSAFAITCISEICKKYDVCLEWKQNSMLEKECHLHGVTDRVKKAEEEIRKLLEAAFPPYWSPMTGGETVKRYKLTAGSSEYETVQAKFAESSPSYAKIKHIERIQNRELYKTFKPQKDMRMADNQGQSVTRQLFHGTLPDKVDLICRSGFDRGFTGENGTAYGRGSYFALKSSYSVRYSGQVNRKYIFLAEVITGDYTQGSSKYKTAPEKDSNGMKYDSCVDNVSNPTIFVVFRDVSAYPSYLITFQ